jgi:hypothetical protein
MSGYSRMEARGWIRETLDEVLETRRYYIVDHRTSAELPKLFRFLP